MGKTVYVGNISHETTDETLRELFAAHGEVLEVRVVTDRYTGRSRGFSFVDMATAQAANTAISEVDGQSVDGRQLRVAEAKPRRRRDSDRDQYTYTRGW
jgi:RNA recognition motif-containing protein